MPESNSNQDGNGMTLSENNSVYKPHCELTEKHKKVMCGLFLMLTLSISWVGCTEFAQDTFSYTFNAPFAVVYFCTSWMVIFYPLYMAAMYLFSKGDMEPKQLFRESLKMYRDQQFRPLQFFGKTAIFCFVWTGANYSYIRALGLIGAMDVTALFSTNQSFVYMLSWIVLFEKFIAIRILAMIFSITGIVLFAYVDGFGSQSMWGVVLAVASASGAAVYKVLFKKFVGEGTFGKVSLFLSLIGFGNMVFLWPLLLTLYFTKSETIDWSTVPWTSLCASASLATVYQLLVNYAGTLTFSFFIGLGLVVGIPLCAVADLVWKNINFPGMKIAATVLIEIGMVLIILPEDWHNALMRTIRWKQREEPPITDTPHARLHWTSNI